MYRRILPLAAALALLLGSLTPAPAGSQVLDQSQNYARVEVTIGTEQTVYYEGDAVKACGTVAGPGTIRLIQILPTGTSFIVAEGWSEGVPACWALVAGSVRREVCTTDDPANGCQSHVGRECVRMIFFSDFGGVRLTEQVQSCYEVLPA